ncbi:trehalose-phosphatase [candidate division WOR-1 bacterium RIFOXYB2_FULL_42_35]|uniref:Trehalose 6-phosphate phosphatase n=1 Tax=candidate division WOR-1 bacterium RIFOXYC2_FULL_41_25 TaxID=1802586 RepID=A0A1F4TR85_UNCSA|nr:MAG: trehalose-phosphatase [candidate division WOR-1 bacterium RIFOXYB2_FULL_42_35]OGC35109.1 MAG: trehalose-phosphatase [candidate division WOR-1 bacterium RIFOXYC2_FULL_41_25]OGC41466.1 MAG: trehalose-phosphatase [candidate division WOR-1 bacterium RIFOXYD2_FULL_41_8]
MKYLLLLDYDGTLTPIVSRPELATLTPERRKLLKQLANNKNFKIALVSGRTLSSLKAIVKIPGLIYIGNHGFEINFKNKLIVQPEAAKAIPTLKLILKKLKEELRPIIGVIVEDKKYTLSFHFRSVEAKMVPKVKKIFWQVVKPYLKKIRVTKGKKVFEVRPPLDWHKGQAVLWLLKQLKGGYLPIYIGDDVTDEDAFKAIKQSYRVGRKKKSYARHTLRNVTEVYRFLGTLVNSA